MKVGVGVGVGVRVGVTVRVEVRVELEEHLWQARAPPPLQRDALHARAAKGPHDAQRGRLDVGGAKLGRVAEELEAGVGVGHSPHELLDVGAHEP